MEKSSRRSFFKVAGISLLGISGAAPVLNSFAESQVSHTVEGSYVKNESTLQAKRWGMIINTKELSEDNVPSIIEACHKAHNVPNIDNKKHEVKWIWEEEFKHAFPTVNHDFLNERVENLKFLVFCNHCNNPPCVRACPTKATFKRDDGIVLMDFHRCIGCRFCMAACPYGSRSFNFENPRPFIEETNPLFPTRMKGVVEKCNFCAERLAVGKIPACVEAANGAIVFGDLNDPESEIRQVLKENYTIRRKPALGTGPSVYYIV
ncbi:MAG: 4Fe-4S dicluster domain-containing protein [Desulfobacterales bacterium]|nr:4Fe-4S dicluster domain-containing protein [Desulfobacterales bacterium]